MYFLGSLLDVNAVAVGEELYDVWGEDAHGGSPADGDELFAAVVAPGAERVETDAGICGQLAFGLCFHDGSLIFRRLDFLLYLTKVQKISEKTKCLPAFFGVKLNVFSLFLIDSSKLKPFLS